jgi:hypothetical protein
MLLVTEDAVLVCLHELGKVDVEPSQDLVTIADRALLVEPDPEGRSISGCPMYGALIKPCTRTLPVTAGYSDLLRIDGRRVCLQTLTGLSDGTPPGTVRYKVNTAGQGFVQEDTA